jgi:hypothetical protein
LVNSVASLLDSSGGSMVRIERASGVFGDGWCEPVVRLRAVAARTVTVCRFDVWLKAEDDRETSRLTARFGDGDAFTFEIPHDRPITIAAACRAAPDDVIDAMLECDNEVSDRGGDIRPLSFKIDRIAFA